MPAAALAFAAAAAAPGSAAATPTGFSHGVSIGPTTEQGVCFAVVGCGLGALASVRGFTSGRTRRPCLRGPETPALTGRVGRAAWGE